MVIKISATNQSDTTSQSDTTDLINQSGMTDLKEANDMTNRREASDMTEMIVQVRYFSANSQYIGDLFLFFVG